MADGIASSLSSDRSLSEGDGEPLYVNYALPLTRMNSDTTSAQNKRKPKPGPKPSVVQTTITKFNLRPQQTHLPTNNVGGSHGSGTPPSVAQKQTSAKTSQLRPVVNARPTAKATPSHAVLPKNDPVIKTPNSKHKQALLVNSNMYAEAVEVQQCLLPPSERDGALPGVPIGPTYSAEEPIYEEAVPVRISRSETSTDGRPKESTSMPLLPPQNEESIYEEAAPVSIDRLATAVHQDNVLADPDPLYADAFSTQRGRVPPTKQKFVKQQISNAYEEAAQYHRQSEDSDNSDSDEDPLYFKLLVIQSNQRSRDMWDLKSNSTLAKAALETKAQRMSMMLSGSNLHPHKASPVHATLSAKPSLDLSSWSQSASRCLDNRESMLSSMMATRPGSTSNHIRQFLISNILALEKEHMALLETMTEYMGTFKNVALSPQQQLMIPVVDIDTIFYKVPELHEVYFKLVHGLEMAMKNWTPEQAVAPLFKEFAFEEYSIGIEYLKNYHKAVSTVQRCSAENAQFSALTSAIKYKGNMQKSLQDLLLMPILQFQRNALLLHDLIRVTPVTHSDYDLLQKTLKLAQNFLNEANGNGNKDSLQDQRYVAKHGMLVEQTKRCRKLRTIILFNDFIVCTKQRVVRQTVQFEAKWFIALPDLIVEEKFSVQEEKHSAILHQQQIEELKRTLIESQLELRAELKKDRPVGGQRLLMAGNQTKPSSKTRKKIVDLESQLVLSSPYLRFKLYSRLTKKEYTLLMESDYERNNWKDIIKGLTSKVAGPMKLTQSEVQAVLNQNKISTESTTDDSEAYLEERLTGNLNVTIHKLRGLTEVSSSFCSIEIDSFGHFFEKAKTRVLNSAEPQWDEDFDIDLEGSQTLRIMCYKLGSTTDCLIGKSALELNQVWLVEETKEEEITLKEGIVLTMSLRYTSAEDMMRRTFREALFGGRIENIVKNEGCSIPLLVTSCVEELERRGLQTVGLYRVCGRSDSVDSLKKDFNRNSAMAAKKLHDFDVSVLASLLKLYFRELPEALFTDDLYPGFVKGFELSDPDAKENFMANQISLLPEANYVTAMFVMDHLVRVSKQEQSNKMTLSNLAVIFGPTLLRPAAKEVHRTPMEQLILQNTEAMTQTAILLYLLNLKEKNFNFTRLCTAL